MSVLAGVYNFDGAPVDPKLISAMGTALDPLGPDGGNEICAGSVGMTYRAFHTTRESQLECQPLVSCHGHILTWDGRIDNRDELINLLRDLLPKLPTDADIAMAVCRKWGADGIVKIIGDFALAWVDTKNRTLLLTRDAIGARSLCYHVNEQRIFWSSSIKSILDFSGCNIEINEEYIASYLAFYPEKPGHTPFTEIFSVKPGHVVIVINGQVRDQRFWVPESIKDIHYKSDAEYEEHFRELIFEAIKSHLRYPGTVYSELSGGLDSTTVVSVADLLIKEGKCKATKLRTTSHFTKDSLNSDEGKYIRYVEGLRGETGVHERLDDYCMRFASPQAYFQPVPSTGLLHNGSGESLRNEMAKDESRVILSGHGGDQVLWAINSASPDLANLLFQCRLIKLNRQVKIWGKEFKKPYLQVLWHQAILPLLPEQIRSRFEEEFRLPQWLDQRYVKKTGMDKRNHLPMVSLRHSSPGKRIRLGYVLKAVELVSEGAEREEKWTDIGYPLLYRPLVEFMLAIPFDQVIREHELRSLQRRAMKDVVPAKVLRRKYKSSIEDGYLREIRRQWPKLQELFKEPLVCARGYIDAAALQQAIGLALHGSQSSTVQLLKTISLEIWLRSLEHYRTKGRGYINLLQQPV